MEAFRKETSKAQAHYCVYLFFILVLICMWGRACPIMLVEVRGQLLGVNSLLPTRASRVQRLSCQACIVPSAAGPFHLWQENYFNA